MKRKASSDNKIQKLENDNAFETDTLQIILDFLPKSDHNNFSLTNKQFREAFISSRDNLNLKLILHLKNSLKRLSNDVEKIKWLNQIPNLMPQLENFVKNRIFDGTYSIKIQKESI